MMYILAWNNTHQIFQLIASFGPKGELHNKIITSKYSHLAALVLEEHSNR